MTAHAPLDRTTRNDRAAHARNAKWRRAFFDGASRDQERSAEYYALADKLRLCGELERAGQWQAVAASYARAARNSLFHLLTAEAARLTLALDWLDNTTAADCDSYFARKAARNMGAPLRRDAGAINRSARPRGRLRIDPRLRFPKGRRLLCSRGAPPAFPINRERGGGPVIEIKRNGDRQLCLWRAKSALSNQTTEGEWVCMPAAEGQCPSP